jgi:hypothetical protein
MTTTSLNENLLKNKIFIKIISDDSSRFQEWRIYKNNRKT